MKNFFAVILFALVTCTSFARAAAVDIDLTKMSSTMVYSTVFNMVNNPTQIRRQDDANARRVHDLSHFD